MQKLKSGAALIICLLCFFLVVGINNISSLFTNGLELYYFPATEYNRLNGIDLPWGIVELTEFRIRMCKDEFEPFSMIVRAKEDTREIEFGWSDFVGADTISATNLDASITKIWYQAGVSSKDIRNPNLKKRTQELLVKNDSLLIINRNTKINYLLVETASGNKTYINISDSNCTFPENVFIYDEPDLKKFSLKENSYRQIWFTLKTPQNCLPGNYLSHLIISKGGKTIAKIPIHLEVHPFKLDPPKLTYGIYFHGLLKYRPTPFHYYRKDEEQLILELSDAGSRY